MASYEYDDFRVTLSPRIDSGYDVRAVDVEGVEQAGSFLVPLSTAELEHTVLGLANTHRLRRRGRSGHAPSSARESVREVGGGGPPQLSAQRIGGALADALLGAEIGRHYDAAVARAAHAGRGVRLSLSLAGAPELLNLPWEFLYRRPRFLASQRHSPLVRHLDTGSLAPPPSIGSTVRMLGVISSPVDLTPLDVASERERVERAVAKVAALGRIELDWLEPATPRSLRQALRDDSYHILHYVGHSDFTADGEGLLFLEGGTDRHSTPLDSTALANLLSDQTRLRLVVLNSCDGARTTLVDPFAGVATTLIQLGVPAVVAMQFEITDAAAIVFADELYTNLIGRQDPIDAAVAEARKAIYIEVDKVEWATPVLFVRHPEVKLFDFAVSAAPLPVRHPDSPDDGVPGEPDDEQPDHAIALQSGQSSDASPPSARPRRKRWVVITIAAALALVAVAAIVLITQPGDGETATTEPSGPPDPDVPRPHSDAAAIQVLGLDGTSAIHIGDSDSETPFQLVREPGTSDTEPAWDPNTNRLAFTRTGPEGSSIWYAVPGDGGDDPVGKAPAILIPPVDGEAHHLPAWGRDGAAFYFARAADCTEGSECEEELRRATFVQDNEPVTEFGTSFPSLDVLRFARQDVVAERFVDARSIAPDPLDSKVVAVVDAEGLHLATVGGSVTTLETERDLQSAVFITETEESHVVAVSRGDDASTTSVLLYHRDGGELDAKSLADLDASGTISSAMGRSISGITFVSLTTVEDDTDVVMTVDDRNDEYPPAALTLSATDNLLTVDEVVLLPSPQALGRLDALVL